MNSFKLLPRAAAIPGAAFFGLLFASAPLPAADVGYYSVSKGILFAQTNAGPPQIRAGYSFLFQAVAVPESNGLSGATVQWPFATLPLSPRFPGAPFTFTDRQPTLELLDLYYPNGNFTVAMATVHDGPHSGAVAVTGDDYPNPPAIANHAQAQAINPSNDFTLRWSGFSGGTDTDFIYAQIDATTGLVFRTSCAPGGPGALNGTNGSLLIPSNTLAHGRAYAARLVFVKVVGTNTVAYPGVTGAGAYFTQTDFSLATTGAGDATPPAVVSVSPPPGATNVPVNTPVVVTFSEPMRAESALFVSGTASLSSSPPAWSPDGLTVVLQPPAMNWPPNTALGFVLNPSDGQLRFNDVSRNPLAMETSFQFRTGTNIVPPAVPSITDAKRLVTGRFQFKLLGESNRTYAAEASTNLMDWVSLGTNIAWGGSIQYFDTNAPGFPWRFYRGVAR